MSVEQYAEEMAGELYDVQFIDPLMILAIIQALAAIMSLWKDCQPEHDRTPDEVRDFLAEGGPVRRRFARRRMTKAIREKLNSEELGILGPPEDFVHYFIAKGVQKESFADAYLEACEA